MVLKEVIAYYSTQASLYCTMLDATKHNVGNKAEWVLSGKFQTRLSPLRQMAQKESMADCDRSHTTLR